MMVSSTQPFCIALAFLGPSVHNVPDVSNHSQTFCLDPEGSISLGTRGERNNPIWSRRSFWSSRSCWGPLESHAPKSRNGLNLMRIKEQEGDRSRTQPKYNLWKAYYPLEGGPSQLPLHVAVVVEEIGKEVDCEFKGEEISDEMLARKGNLGDTYALSSSGEGVWERVEYGGDKSRAVTGRLTLFDFLPLKPLAFETTVNLLSGRSVPGELRIRELRFLPSRIEYIGVVSSNITLDDMRRFVAAYPDDLHLLKNSCVTFVDRFLQNHLES